MHAGRGFIVVWFLELNHAVAFNPFNGDGVDTSLSIEDREIGGLGIHLIKQLMSSYKYVRKSNENLVTLTMNLS